MVSAERDSSPAPRPTRDDARTLSLLLAGRARAYATSAVEAGLAVTRLDGSRTPIAISSTPIIVDDATLRARAHTAGLLSSAGARMARLALRREDLRPLVLGALSPLEAELAERTDPTPLATTRVDFFLPSAPGAGPRALELNATIPAMQGYSDIAAGALLAHLGDAIGAPARIVDAWRARNGSNAAALWRALIAGYRRVRPGREPARVALLCRRQDAQLTELEFLRDAFRAHGVDARIAHPDQLELGAHDVRVDGATIDLLYRHLFVRRLEEPGAEASRVLPLLREPNGARVVVLNPPASQVETKSVFALLSSAHEDGALAREAGLTDAERDAIARSVPWTRVLRAGALADRVAAEPDRFVLKRVWDYGGRAVWIGRERDTDAFAERVRIAWPDADALAWPALVARAAADTRGGGFVVQERVDSARVRHTLCTPDGAREADVFVDFSMFASVGIDVDDPDWGGVCRTSTSSIVNIMGGGGVAPILKASVAREIVDASAAVGAPG